MGCFQDNGQRDLPNIVENQSPVMTREYCSALCKFQNYQYAGLQAG